MKSSLNKYYTKWEKGEEGRFLRLSTVGIAPSSPSNLSVGGDV